MGNDFEKQLTSKEYNPNAQSGFAKAQSAQSENFDGMAEAKQRELTFGEQLVGLTFNPAGDAKVNRAKQLCAELTDLLKAHVSAQGATEQSELMYVLYPHAIGQILNAQMNVVKLLTLRY